MAARKRSTAKRGRPAAKKTQGIGRQGMAIILIAVAAFLLCVAIIQGEAIAWMAMHDFYLGLFGVMAYLVPVLVGTVAVLMAMDKPAGRVTIAALFMVAIASLLQVIWYDVDTAGDFLVGWGAAFADGYGGHVSGALGAVLGYAIEYLCGDLPAKIVLGLLLFVAVMLFSGTTLGKLFGAVAAPVKKTGENLRAAYEEAEEKRQSRDEEEAAKPVKARSKIDIEMGDGYPEEKAEKTTAEQVMELLAGKEPEKPKTKTSKKSKMDKVADALAEETDESTGVEMPEDLPDEVMATNAAPEYRMPPLTLLDEGRPVDDSAATTELKNTAELLVQTLREFGVETKVINISRGPAVTRYELGLAAGVKISRITGLSDDIALRLAATGVRIEAPIPGKAAVGIEIPNRVKSMVTLRELIDSAEFRDAKSKLTVALGKDITGQRVMVDLAKMPHLLIAGTTGSGKSVCTNSMIQSILFRARPDEVKLLLIDPKQVEFMVYNGTPHLIVPVVTDPRKAAGALGWAVTEMLTRYQKFAAAKVRDIKAYNEKAVADNKLPYMPQILIVIDELADLMMAAGNEVEDSICRLAQMARAAGMHMVIATQRPSVDVITGLIKANIPSRLSLTVASAVDSRTIIDGSGAEKLLGNGDMLFMPMGMSKPVRVQGCFVSDREVNSVVQFLKPEEDQTYDEAVVQEIERQAAQVSVGGKASAPSDGDNGGGGFDDADPMLEQAVEVVLEAGEASTSLLQRKLRLGYARAGRLIDDMESRGIVGPHVGSKPRELLITRAQWMERNMMTDENLAVEEEI
ncbi:MAG: DUF87 domain-containing protein [Clostridia bacterium]|nr:DUF87 domain-containing protein [Clostridia bacterium]